VYEADSIKITNCSDRTLSQQRYVILTDKNTLQTIINKEEIVKDKVRADTESKLMEKEVKQLVKDLKQLAKDLIEMEKEVN